jgi:hypothetical protein
MTNSVLAKMAVMISANAAEFNRALAESNKGIKGFQDSLLSMGRTLGIGFGIQQISSFGIELVKLAGVADGVNQAFVKIANSAKVLQEMKDATRGTVSELELMKAAVQSSNFGIPIEQLGTLFEFAYERAKATGQSVDYLVNSIVVGIGRKSPLILDNLGISAVQLKEKLRGVSTEAATVGQVAEAVGKIATASLEATGKSAETASEKIAQIGATWDDIKVRIGTGLADLLAAGENPDALLTNFNNQLIVWADDSVPLWKKVLGSAQEYADMVVEIREREKLLANTTPLGPDALGTAWDKFFKSLKGGGGDGGGTGVIERINAEMKRLTEEKTKAFDLAHITSYNKQLETLKQTLEAINKAGLGPKTNPLAGLKVSPGNIPSIADMTLGKQELGPGKDGGMGGPMTEMIAQMIEAQERAEKLAKTLKNSLGSAISGVARAMGQMAAGMDVNFGAQVLGSIGQMAIQLGETLIATGIGVEAFKSSLKSLNGLAAIAAGAALVAAGSAFASLAGSIGGGGGGGGGSNPRMADNLKAQEITINVMGEFELHGNVLRAAVKKADYVNGRTGG